jgi:hypothetical protein
MPRRGIHGQERHGTTRKLSLSEKRTLEQVAQRELEAGVGWDWVALQRLKRIGLVERGTGR